jgi:hypothetical protein
MVPVATGDIIAGVAVRRVGSEMGMTDCWRVGCKESGSSTGDSEIRLSTKVGLCVGGGPGERVGKKAKTGNGDGLTVSEGGSAIDGSSVGRELTGLVGDGRENGMVVEFGSVKNAGDSVTGDSGRVGIWVG